ncbi:hypothetical protein ACEPAI_3030 [Sanghuangporus weigelae]
MAQHHHHHHHDPTRSSQRQNTNTRSGSGSGTIIIEAIPREEREEREELMYSYNQHIEEIIDDAKNDTSGYNWRPAIEELKRLKNENTIRKVNDPNFRTGAFSNKQRVYSVLHHNIQNRKKIFEADRTKTDPSGAIWQMAERVAFGKMNEYNEVLGAMKNLSLR